MRGTGQDFSWCISNRVRMRNTGQSRVGLGWHCVHVFSFVYLLCLCCPEEEKLACKMRLAIKTIIDTSLHPLHSCTATLLALETIWMPTSFLTSRLIFFHTFIQRDVSLILCSFFCNVAMKYECYIQSNETATAFQLFLNIWARGVLISPSLKKHPFP